MRQLNGILDEVRGYIDDPQVGLPEEVFLFATEITPMVNVDLLIRDESNRILLSWRDDPYHGKGWHVPGGILRVRESFDDRIHKTALNEIGCDVNYTKTPIDIVPIVSFDRKTRCHFISFIFECQLNDSFEIDNGQKKRNEIGFLEWFKRYPEDMIKEHEFYKKYFVD